MDLLLATLTYKSQIKQITILKVVQTFRNVSITETILSVKEALKCFVALKLAISRSNSGRSMN